MVSYIFTLQQNPRKDALGLSLMMQYIKQKEDKQFIFLTLTTPNVTVEHLEDEIKIIMSRLDD